MSNSQNEKNEQQNNLCTTLTEQWKKGELKSGWYFVKVGKYEAEIDLYDDDHSQWLNSCDKDIYPVEVLAPVPSYEEWMRTKYSLDDYKRLSEMRGKIIDKMDESNSDSEKYLRQKNQKLKDVISKMCMELVDPDDDMSNGLAEYFNQDLLLEIHEVLK